MEIDISHVLLAAMLLLAGMLASRMLFDRSPTPAEQRNRRPREYRWLDPQKKWAECPCCGCPTLNCSQSVTVPTCVVCEWEETDDEGELTRAREDFRRYGVAYSPEEAATWGGTPPSRQEVAAKLEIIQLSRKNPEREQDFGAWAAEMQLLLMALASARARRVEDAVPEVPDVDALEAPRPADDTAGHPCPCCGFLTLSLPSGNYEICSVCGWEDDPVQLRWPGYRGGANHESLCEAQRDFLRRAAEAPHLTEDVPRAPGWRPLREDECVSSGDTLASGAYYWLPSAPD